MLAKLDLKRREGNLHESASFNFVHIHIVKSRLSQHTMIIFSTYCCRLVYLYSFSVVAQQSFEDSQPGVKNVKRLYSILCLCSVRLFSKQQHVDEKGRDETERNGIE